MPRRSDIFYNTARFQEQLPRIARSRKDALAKISEDSHCKELGVTRDDPPEIWRYVVSRTPKPRKLSKEDAASAAKLVTELRQLDPTFNGDPESYQSFREALGKPILHETVAALGKNERRVRIEAGKIVKDVTCTSDQLAAQLAKLLAIYKNNRPSSRAKPEDKQDALLLADNWLVRTESNQINPRFSLCFWSDKALTKLLYWCAHKLWLPPDKEDSQIERVSQLRQRLKLIPSKPRLIRDLEWRAGTFHFVPHKSAIWKRGRQHPR